MTNYKQITFEEACRYNSGKNLIDSGCAYGYAYERPPITKDTPSIRLQIFRNELHAILETAKFLDEKLEIDHKAHKAFFNYSARPSQQDNSWWESEDDFMRLRGYEKVCEGNTCNGETDLSQDFCYHIWQPIGRRGNHDWPYDDEARAVLFIHTGCDIRWGYTYPIFVKAQGFDEYTIPMNFCVGWYLTGKDGEPLEGTDEFSCGYSSNPSYHLNKEIKRVFPWTATEDSVCIQLKDGRIAKASPEMPY